MELDEINLEMLGELPWPIKTAIILALCAIVLGAAFWFDTRSQMATLKKEQRKEIQLKQTFESKQNLAANLEAYQEQLKQIKKSFGELLRQLPEKTEVPGLLEDISKVGTASGLHFTLFKPSKEDRKEFYVELPIEISVTGTYHQLGVFVSHVAALPRIVTLNNFTIVGITHKKTKDENNFVRGEELQMDITAKTYRYSDEHESETQSDK